MAAEKLHADDTPVPVLAPGNGKTKTGRLWTYVRDDRPAGDQTPPAVWFAYTPDRKGEHPQAHLSKFTGHAAGGWLRGVRADLRRRSHSGSGLLGACAQKVLRSARWRTNRLSRRKRWNASASCMPSKSDIRGRPPEERREVRNTRSRPLLESLKQWLEETLGKLSRKSDTAMAVRYALGRWEALMRYCDDGRIEIDNNAAERALRAVALGRKNYLFAGSDRWWRTRRGDLQSDRHRQTERNRSRNLSAERAVSHRGSSHQPHRGTAAMEFRPRRCPRLA